VYVVGANGDGERLAFSGPDAGTDYQHPTFTPDGARIVADRRDEIEIGDVDGSNVRDIVPNTNKPVAAPSVSPDGFHVAFATWCEPAAESIWFAPIGGIDMDPCFVARRLSAKDGKRAGRPAWGPNDRIAYEGVGGSMSLVGASSLVTTTLLNDTADNRNPAWVPACAPLP
jgi:hypothetical protein